MDSDPRIILVDTDYALLQWISSALSWAYPKIRHQTHCDSDCTEIAEILQPALTEGTRRHKREVVILYGSACLYSTATVPVEGSRILDLEDDCAVRWRLVSDVCPGMLD
jgi:hypothetical protein